MNHCFRLGFLVFILSCTLVLSVHGLVLAENPAKEGEVVEIGRAIQVDGKVERKGVGSEKFEALASGGSVWLFDVLKTQNTGKIKIKLLDGSNLALSPNSTLQLTRYVYDPKSGRLSTLFALAKGEVLSVVSKAIKSQGKNSFEIETRNSVAGVRGSEFLVRREKGETQVWAIQDSTWIQTKDGKIREIKEGETITVDSKFGLRPPKHFIVDDVSGKFKWKVPVWEPPQGFRRESPRSLLPGQQKNLPQPWVRKWRPYDFPEDRPIWFNPPASTDSEKGKESKNLKPDETFRDGTKRSERSTLTVLAFTSTGLLPEQGYAAQNITEYMTNKFSENRQFKTLDRSRLQEMLAEKNLNEWGLVNNPRQAKLYFGVDYMVAGGVSRLGDSFSLSARIINCNTTEIVAAKTTNFKTIDKLRNAADIVVHALGEKVGDQAGDDSIRKPKELYLGVDSKQFYRTAQNLVAQLKSPRIQIIGEVLEINHAKKQARIKITQGIGIQEGVRLQVVEEGFDGGREVAQVVILEVKKTGEALVGPAKGDFQALDMGAQVQSDPNYRYRIAMGFFEDVEESDEKMIDVFLEKVYEEIGQSNRFESPDENVQSYAKEIKPSDRKQKMTQLFREGVDFYVDGEFTGSMGNRRLSATVWLTANGDKYQKIIIENTGF